MKQAIRLLTLLVAMMAATGNAVAKGGNVTVVVANSSDGKTHGTAECAIDGTAVTVTVAPDDGWQATEGDVTVVATTATANAEARRAEGDASIDLGSSIAVEWTAPNVFTFTLQESQRALVTVNFSRITNMTVTIGAEGMRTYSANVDLDFSGVEGLTAYVCNAYDREGERMVMLKVTSVPAGTGLLLRGTEGSYDVPVTASATYLVNLLVPAVGETTLTPTDGDMTNFVLASKDGVVAFYRVSEAGPFGPQKAYLQLPTSVVGSSRLSISFDDATGMYDAPCTMYHFDDAWYDLQGRKIVHRTSSNGTSKGVYIYKGKKVVR